MAAIGQYLTNMNQNNGAFDTASNLANNLYSMNKDSNTTDAPFKTPDKFSYDAASDPQYQSALGLARQNIQTDQGNTLANLVSHGQGNSSYSAGAVAGVADKAMGNLNNTLLPQFIQQAYNHYQDGIKNDYQTQLANYNANQDKIKNNQWNQTFDAGRTDAGNNLAVNRGTLTGNYTGPDGVTTRTIAGQNLDENTKQSHIDLAQKLSEEYGVKVDPKNDPALAYKQVEGLTPLSKLQQDFNQKLQLGNQDISRQQADTSAYSAQTGRLSEENNKSNLGQDALYKQWANTGLAPDGIPGVAKDTPLYDKTGARQDEQLKNKQGQLDIKSFETERDGMLSSVRSGKVQLPDAMAQINQDEKLGIYTSDLAEKLRSNLRVLANGQTITGDPATLGPKIDTSKIGVQRPNQSVTGLVFGG